MKISPINPVVHQSIKRYLTKDAFSSESFFDYDQCEYVIERKSDEPDILKFGFNSNCTKQIMENGGVEMLDDLYKDNQIPKEKQLEQCDITLGIDTSNIPQTQKVKKTMTDEEADKVRAQNEEIRKQREKTADEIANKFSQFKRDFLGAPLRKAMKGVLAKSNGDFKPCQIDYRKDERFWVFCSNNDASITLEVNFTSDEDQSLARIFLLEMKDCRNVVNAPSVAYHDKQFPQQVLDKFPGADKKKTSNGSITFQVGEQSLKKGLDNPWSQMIGFRQYLNYHLHAIKIQMHTKMRLRVKAMELVVKQARREEDDSKVYKEKHGGEQIVEAKEEKRKEEVFKFSKFK